MSAPQGDRAAAAPPAREFVVEADGPQRLDRYVAEVAGLGSRSQIKQRLAELTVNGKAAKLSQLVSSGDRIALRLAPPPSLDLVAEDIAIDVLFENADVLVVNKPSGMVVHPAAGNHSGTLVHGLLFRLRDLGGQDFEDEGRPGIVHRLDKDTSGVMIVAKHPAAHEFLAAQFQARTTRKTYLAIARGRLRFDSRRVEGFIRRDPAMRQRFVHDPAEGKSACTDFEMAASRGDHCLLVARPLTGRTHQIRVHARLLGLPLVGDPVYGRPRPGDPRLMLHAYRLEIVLPGEDAARTFTAPIPPDMAEAAARYGLAEALLTC